MRTTAEKEGERGRGDTLPMMESKRKKGRKKKKMEDMREKAGVEFTGVTAYIRTGYAPMMDRRKKMWRNGERDGRSDRRGRSVEIVQPARRRRGRRGKREDAS